MKQSSRLRCPHCGRRGMSDLEKVFSSPDSPRRCHECGNLIASHVSPVIRLVAYAVATAYVFGGFIFVAALAGLWVMLVVGAVVIPLPGIVRWLSPVVPLTEERVRRARRIRRLGYAIIILFFGVSWGLLLLGYDF